MTSASSPSDTQAPGPDWPAIRQAYVSRDTAVRELCRLHGIHSQTLYRKAGKEGWPLRRESQSDAEQRQTLLLLGRLRRLAEGQIEELEMRRARTADPSLPGEPERDARALTSLAKLIEQIAIIEAKHQARRDVTRDGIGRDSEADRARRRSELADKLIAMLEQERGSPLPE